MIVKVWCQNSNRNEVKQMVEIAKKMADKNTAGVMSFVFSIKNVRLQSGLEFDQVY